MDEQQLQRQPGEGITAFFVRQIQHAAWLEGYEARRSECHNGHHGPGESSPYTDQAYAMKEKT